MGDTHFTLLAEFINDETQKVHARGQQIIVYTDLEGVPQAIPEEIRSMLKAAQY